MLPIWQSRMPDAELYCVLVEFRLIINEAVQLDCDTDLYLCTEFSNILCRILNSDGLYTKYVQHVTVYCNAYYILDRYINVSKNTLLHDSRICVVLYVCKVMMNKKSYNRIVILADVCSMKRGACLRTSYISDPCNITIQKVENLTYYWKIVLFGAASTL